MTRHRKAGMVWAVAHAVVLSVSLQAFGQKGGAMSSGGYGGASAQPMAPSSAAAAGKEGLLPNVSGPRAGEGTTIGAPPAVGPDTVLLPPFPTASGMYRPSVAVSGYLQPQFGFRYRPGAIPRDQWEFGALSSRAGVILTGKPFEDWAYTVHFVVDAAAVSVLTGVGVSDVNGDGFVDDVVTSRRSLSGTVLEEVTATYQPAPFFSLKGGAMRMPFTVALGSANTALMFPNRPGPNELFNAGSDAGLLSRFNFWDGRLMASAGAFNGSSLGLNPEGFDPRGLVWSGRLDVNPMGPLPGAEGDLDRGPLRFGFGSGVLYRTGSYFERTGFEATSFDEIRVSGSARVSVAGFFAQAEYFRRQQVDRFNTRPRLAQGAYAQASYYAPVGEHFAFAPIARAGFATEDMNFSPRQAIFLEGGLAFYPRADMPQPDRIRLIAQYLGEFRPTERDSAHGAIFQVQFRF